MLSLASPKGEASGAASPLVGAADQVERQLAAALLKREVAEFLDDHGGEAGKLVSHPDNERDAVHGAAMKSVADSTRTPKATVGSGEYSSLPSAPFIREYRRLSAFPFIFSVDLSSSINCNGAAFHDVMLRASDKIVSTTSDVSQSVRRSRTSTPASNAPSLDDHSVLAEPMYAAAMSARTIFEWKVS